MYSWNFKNYENLNTPTVQVPTNPFILCMNANIFRFAGRGQALQNIRETYRMIDCQEGTVLALIVHHGSIGFIHSYCRFAIMDQWGIYCHDPFRRRSDPALSRSWAEPIKKGMLVFRSASLEIVTEAPWMCNK
jgi:hypothetical protein